MSVTSPLRNPHKTLEELTHEDPHVNNVKLTPFPIECIVQKGEYEKEKEYTMNDLNDKNLMENTLYVAVELN